MKTWKDVEREADGGYILAEDEDIPESLGTVRKVQRWKKRRRRQN